MRRILPASLFVTACALLVGTLILMPTELEDFADSALAHLACSANFFFWLGDKNGYFTDSADYFPLLHMWSLSIEEQFYFVFPFLMYLLRNRSTRTIVAFLSLIWIVSFATSLWGIQRYPAATFFTPPTRFWELLTGAILALLTSTRKRPLTTTVAEFVALAGMLGILVPIFVYDKFTTFPAATALPPCLGCAAVIFGSAQNQTWIARVLSNRLFSGIGAISYSLYLWHWPIFSFYRIYIGTHPDVGESCALLLLSCIAGYLSWRWIETPFRERRLGARRPALFAEALACTSGLFAAGLYLSLSGGLADSVPPELLKDIKHRGERFAANRSNGVIQFPILGTPNGARVDFLLWGDSHGLCIAEAVSDAAAERRLSGRAALRIQTPPVQGVWCKAEEPETNWTRDVLTYIREHDVKNVILVARWTMYMDGYSDLETLDVGERYRYSILVREPGRTTATVESATALLESKLSDTVRALREAGVQVWLVGQVPEQNSTRLALSWLRAVEIGSPFELPSRSQRQVERHRRTAALLDEVAAENEGVTVVDPTAALFTTHEIEAKPVRDGRCLYRDDNHLSLYGSQQAVQGGLAATLDMIKLSSERRAVSKK